MAPRMTNRASPAPAAGAISLLAAAGSMPVAARASAPASTAASDRASAPVTLAPSTPEIFFPPAPARAPAPTFSPADTPARVSPSAPSSNSASAPASGSGTAPSPDEDIHDIRGPKGMLPPWLIPALLAGAALLVLRDYSARRPDPPTMKPRELLPFDAVPPRPVDI